MRAPGSGSVRTTGTAVATAGGTALAIGFASLVVTVATPLQEASASRASSSITMTWSASKVYVGRTVTVRGRVTSRHLQRRTVTLNVYLKSGWHRVGVTHTNARGGYSMYVPTGWYRSRPMQLRSPGTRRSGPVRSAHRMFTVKPRYHPAGSAASWSRETPGEERRVDPCRVVTYRVHNATPTALADVRAAVVREHKATGIQFRYLGAASSVPRSAAAVPVGTNLVIGWASPSDSGGTLSLGDLSTYKLLDTAAAHDRQGAVRRIVQAGVIVNTAEDDYSSSMRRNILIHEIAHTLGMGHTTGRSQRMDEDVYPGEALAWGAGDLTGLGRVGLVEGCLTASS